MSRQPAAGKPAGTKPRGRKRTRPYSASAITNQPAPRGTKTKAKTVKARSAKQKTGQP